MTDPSTRVIACLQHFPFIPGTPSGRLRHSIAKAFYSGGVAHDHVFDAEHQLITESGVAIICHAPADMLEAVSACSLIEHVQAVVLVTFAALHTLPQPQLVHGKPFHVLQVGCANAE